MCRAFFSLMVLLLSKSILAQNRFDVFYVAGNYNFLDATPVIKHNYERALAANLSTPVILKDSSVWLTTFDYQYYNLPNAYKLTDVNPIKTFGLHGCIIRTGYIKKLSNRKAIHALFIPRLMTDFKVNTAEALQFGAMVAYENSSNTNVTWRAGVAYNQECFGPLVIPVLYLDWSITRSLKFTGLLPIYGKLYVMPNKNVSTGIHFIGLTTSYQIAEKNFENHYVQRNAIDVSWFGNVQLIRNIYFEGRLGYSLTKDYGLYANDEKAAITFPLFAINDKRVRANNDFDGSIFIHGRLLYSLPIK
jgi:hypothetical protein